MKSSQYRSYFLSLWKRKITWKGFLGLLVVIAPALVQAAEKDGFFEQEVLPILKKRCYECHSHTSGNLEGGLAIDWKSGWAIGGDSGPAIIPGNPEDSLLIDAVKRNGLEMPPEQALPQSEIATLVKWIKQGALDPRVVQPTKIRPTTDWWSLRPLLRPDVPMSQNGTHPIDAFVDKKLKQAKLKRSPSTDRRDLIRRLSFDLHGLAPTYEQVQSFQNDKNTDAYTKLVDSFLSSPRYGERWARHWLDVIHFADTHGCEHDVFRDNSWRYRDYVIRAFNEDISWQDFIRQQLAANVFSPQQSDQIAALGFLGAGPLDLSTAGTAPVTFDYMDRDDLVTQTMAAFVSTTANCARCHDHKFDPISQKDYYSLQAVFAGIGKGDREFDESAKVHQQRIHWKSVLDAVNQKNADILLSEENQKLVATWEAERLKEPVKWDDLFVDEFVSTDGADLERLADGSIQASGIRPDVDTYCLTTTSKLNTVTAVRLDVLSDDALPMKGPGRQDNGNLHLTEVEIQLFDPGSTKPKRLAIAQATTDFNQAGWTINHAVDNNLKTAWGIYPSVGVSHYAVFELTESVQLSPDAKLVIILKQRHGAGHLIGRCKVSATNSPAASAAAIPIDVTQALSIPQSTRSPEQQLTITAHALQLIANTRLAQLPKPVKVFAASTSMLRGQEQGKKLAPKQVHVLTRGDIEKPTTVAAPGALSALKNLSPVFDLTNPDDESTRRAAMANWIASPDNPLTWRSIANRVWQFHFGIGLCDTPSDFGRMGGTPSHPQLLDWLACELRDNNGSLKHLHRIILTSQTYQQSSQSRVKAATIDGDNRLLWRANRNRLDAESYFDAVLQASGRLNLEMGGPGIQHFKLTPGQQSTPQVDYTQFDWASKNAGRRAIYRVVWRGIPDPLFESLDFPDLGLLSPKRSHSVSALQSLTLWNHPFLLYHCEQTALRISKQSTNAADHIRNAFQEILLRNPTANELDTFNQYNNDFGLAASVRLLLNSNEFLFVN